MTNPFVGPKPLSKDNPVFGREREIRELLYLMVSERIVLLHSPSGAGKSSLIQGKGGLLELLGAQFDVWCPTRVQQAPDGFDVRNRYSWSAAVGFEQELPDEMRREPAELAQMSLKEYVAGRPRRSQAPRALIFDQFEEVLRVDPLGVDKKREFFRELGDLLGDPLVWALFVIREDYLAPLDPYARLVPGHLQNRYRIALFKRDEAALAIARTAGGRFLKDAVDKLATDLAAESDYVEPLQLQVVCHGLWEAVEKAGIGKVEERHVEKYGKVGEALSNYYANAVAKIAPGVAIQRIVRDWVGEKLIAGEIRSLVLRGPTHSAGLDNHMVDELVETHLVRREPRGTAVWYELAHDRLIRPVKENNAAWMERHLHWVQKRVEDWEQSGELDGMLLPEQAAEVEAWAKEQGVLTEGERKFVEETKRLAASKRTQRILHWSVAGLAVAAMIGMGVALVYYWQAQAALDEAQLSRGNALSASAASKFSAAKATVAGEEAVRQGEDAMLQRARAESQARMALARQAATQARALGSDQYDKALLLAASAVAMAQRASAEGELNAQLLTEVKGTLARLLVREWMPSRHLWGHTDEVNSVAFSKDGNWLASADEDGGVIVWRTADGKAARKIVVQGSAVRRVAFSLNSRVLAAGRADGDIDLFEVETGKGMGKRLHPEAAKAPVSQVAFQADGWVLARSGPSTVVCNPADGTCRAMSPQLKPTRPAGEEATQSIVKGFPGGPTRGCIVQLEKSSLQLQAVDAGLGVLASVAANEMAAPNLQAASEDCDMAILSGNERGQPQKPMMQVWARKSDRWTRVKQAAFAGEMRGVVLSPGKGRVAWIAGSGVSVLELDGVQEKITSLRGRGNRITALAFSHDAKMLAAGGRDGAVALWDLEQPFAMGTVVADLALEAREFSADGGKLATISGREGAVWDLNKVPVERISLKACGDLSGVTFDPLSGRVLVLRRNGEVTWAAGDCKGPVLAKMAGVYSRFGFVPGGGRVFWKTISGLDVWVFGNDGKLVKGQSYGEGWLSGRYRWYLEVAKEGDKTVSVVDLRKGSKRRLPHEEAGMLFLSTENFETLFSSDDRWLLLPRVTAGANVVWNLETGTALKHMMPEPMVTLDMDDGHMITQGVKELGAKPNLQLSRVPGMQGVGLAVATNAGNDPPSVYLLPRSGAALTIDEDGASLRDVASWKELLQLPLRPESTVVSPDGARVVTAYKNPVGLRNLNLGPSVVWDFRWKTWMERACAIAGRNLTQAEWAREFTGADYETNCKGGNGEYRDVVETNATWAVAHERATAIASVPFLSESVGPEAGREAVRKAIPLMETATKLKPGYRIPPEDWITLCFAGQLFGLRKEITATCEAAVEAHPSHSELRMLLAICRIFNGRGKDAIDELEAWGNLDQDAKRTVTDWIKRLKKGEDLRAEMEKALKLMNDEVRSEARKSLR